MARYLVQADHDPAVVVALVLVDGTDDVDEHWSGGCSACPWQAATDAWRPFTLDDAGDVAAVHVDSHAPQGGTP